MDAWLVGVVKDTLSQAGILSTILFVLFWLERKDRREAWRAYNTLLSQITPVLATVQHALEVLEEELDE